MNPNRPNVGGGRYEDAEPNFYEELGKTAETSGLPDKLTKEDIQPKPGDPESTQIILQRHGAYERSRYSENVGSLPPESAQAEYEAALKYFESYLAALNEEERQNVEIIVVSSDTQYFEGGRRSLETASLAQRAAEEVLKKYGIPTENIINNTGRLSGDGQPRTMPKLREPNFLNESPDFLDFMLEKYGDLNLDFWLAFEEDRHKDVREQMGAEGPDDIADRTAFTIRVLARYAKAFHKANPGKRLIIWGATHYDTISPFVKRDVFEEPKEKQLLVSYGGGFTIDIDSEGNASTELGGKNYTVNIKKEKPNS